MAYATESDLDRTWGQSQIDLVTIDEALGGRDAAKIVTALDDASAIIETYCGRRYALPLNLSETGLRLVSGIVCDIAVSRLATTAGRMSDIIAKRADQAMAWLRDVAAGRADLPVALQPGVSPVDGAAAAITPNEAVLVTDPRTFTRDSLRGY